MQTQNGRKIYSPLGRHAEWAKRDRDTADGKMRACGDAGLQLGLGFGVRDRVGVRVSDGVRISTLYFL